MSQRNVAVAAWILFVVWFGVLFWLSSGPIEEMPGSGIPHIDKLYHAGYFFIGGILLTFAIGRTFSPALHMLVFGVIACTLAVGLFDEWHQSFSPGRSGGDPADLAADVIGGTAALIILLYSYHGRLIGLTERNAPR